MDREISTKTAIVVLLFFGSLIAGWAYFNTQSLLVDAPSLVKQNPKGNLVFHLGSALYESTPDGEDVHQFPFDNVGMSEILGDFDFFSNGDVLLYATTYQQNLLENLETFFRMTASETRQANEDEGFYRCDIYRSSCDRFSHELPAFSRGFRLTIDSEDNVYIADTSRHRVIKANAYGKKVAQFSAGLKFPNDIFWQENVLWIVNTNHHEVLSIDATTLNFGEPLSRFKPNIPKRNFPADLARSEDSWFVLSMDNSMQNGKLGKLDSEGKHLELAEMERGADLLAITRVGDSLILPDIKHLRYRRVNAQNLAMAPDFSSPAIEEHLARSRTSVAFYNTIAWSIIGLGIFSFLILAYVAIKSEVKEIDTKLKPIADDETLDTEMPEGMQEYWIPMSKQFTKAQKSMRWFLPLSVILVGALVVPALITSKSALLLLMPVCLFMAVMYYTWRMLKQTCEMGIGISDDGILVRDHLGKTYSGKNEEISMSQSALCLERAIVTIKLFDIDEFEKWVKPRLKRANQLSETQVVIKQWQLKHPMLIEPMKMFSVMLIAFVFMKLMT